MVARKSGLFRWRLIVPILVGVIALVTPLTALAHGESLSASPAKAMPGDTVTITGKDFDETGVTIPITLESSRGTISLGTVDVPESGEFTTTVKIPADLPPGTYELAVTSSDGKLTVDLAVEGSSSASSASNEIIAAELIPQRTTTETIGVGIVVAALVAAGSFLIMASTEKRPKTQNSAHLSGMAGTFSK